MSNIDTYILLGVLIIYVSLIVSALFAVVQEKKNPVKAMSWIVVITAVPIVGFVCYIIFGRNYRKRRIFKRKVKSEVEYFERIVKRQLYKVNSNFISKRDEVDTNRDIMTLLLNNSSSPLTYNNKVEVLNNGEKAFAEMISALKEAREYIHLEYYMLVDDGVGGEIIDILCEKSRKGVAVRLIYDYIGSWKLTSSAIARLKDAGVEVSPFMRVIFPYFTSKVNYRNHRKVLIIDGKVGFTGGMNIADKYIHGTSKLGAWHDIHLKIEGRAVMSLQFTFIKDWYFITGDELKDVNLFPSLRNVDGNTTLQIATSGPDSHWASIMQAYFKAITQAKEQINIATPYFIPTDQILTAIRVAALCGVEVNILLPYKGDSKVVFWATRSYITDLLEAGVNVYFYMGGFNHSKLLTIDSEFSIVGSANMDVRSFEYNFEISAFIFDKEKTSELKAIFNDDLQNSKKLNLTNWSKRSRKEKTKEAICRITSPLL